MAETLSTPPVPEARAEWLRGLIEEGKRETRMIRQAQGDGALDSVELLSDYQRLMYALSILADRLDAREREKRELQRAVVSIAAELATAQEGIDVLTSQVASARAKNNGLALESVKLGGLMILLTARAEQAERERANLRGYLRWCAARGGAEPVTYGSRLPECVGGLAYYTIAPPSGCTVGPARTFEEALDAAVERYIASRGSAE